MVQLAYMETETKKKKKQRTKKTGKAESKHKKADFNPDMNNYQLKEVCRKDDQT